MEIIISRKRGMLYVVLATLFWGFMGISSRWLSQFGLSYANISLVRCILAASSFTIYSFIRNKQTFKVDLVSLLILFVFGVFSIALGFIFYSASVERIPIAIATVLMFSNPIWVSLYNAVLFRERLTRKTAMIISSSILGCLLLMDVFSTGASNLDIIGVLGGIGNGMTFASQIVIPRYFKHRFTSDTMILYGFWSATLFLLFLANPSEIFQIIQTTDKPLFLIANLLVIGIICTIFANTFYIKSAEHLSTTTTSLMVSLEPVFATIFAFIIFKEVIKGVQLLGGAIVILSILFLVLTSRSQN